MISFIKQTSDVLYISLKTELNIDGEYDPNKVELIKKLSQEVKKKSFIERAIDLTGFYFAESAKVKR